MAKLSLTAAPTFTARASIPIPGGKPAPVEFTFKHRPREELLAWLNDTSNRDDTDVIMDCVSAWELDDPFSAENVAALCSSYSGAAGAIVETYLREMLGRRS
jgi:hypothetical protein